KRLKPPGSSRGSAAGKIDVEHSSIFIVKPSFLERVSKEQFDFCILEDCQAMMKGRYYKGLEKLMESHVPIFAVLTVPDARIASKFERGFGFRVFGWDEDLLTQDAKRFGDIEAFEFEEMVFPSIAVTDLPLDDYHNILNLAWNAYAKSRR